jgi:hypothetical protein
MHKVVFASRLTNHKIYANTDHHAPGYHWSSGAANFPLNFPQEKGRGKEERFNI